MRETSYDAIVIGAGIGGLGVSALLAQAGKRVLILEREGEIGGRVCSFEYRGHTLNIGGPRAGIEGGEVDRLFAAVGVETGERAYFDGFRHYREGRFMDMGELARRATPEERRRFTDALSQVPEEELHHFDDVNAWDYLSTRVKAPELLDLARYLSIGMCTLPRLEDMAASTVMKAARIAQSMPRPYVCVDGYGDYMRILADASKSHGGELLTEARVERIVVEDGRVCGVDACIGGVVSSRRERFHAPVVIAAFPVWELFRFVPTTLFPGEFVDQVQYLARPTAIFGFTAALRQPAYQENYFLLGDAPRAGYPLAGYMATNACPRLAPEGEHRLELSCICEYELGSDGRRLEERIDLLKQDVEEMYPGWASDAIWQKSYVHLVESARTPGREGVYRPGPRAPGVDGLYLTGDTVSSRALPGLETAADSAMICADAILD